jgi:hypothetical protein
LLARKEGKKVVSKKRFYWAWAKLLYGMMLRRDSLVISLELIKAKTRSKVVEIE